MCYDTNFCCVVSGHIDVHFDRKWFNSISYLETPFFDKTVNYSLGVFFFQKWGFDEQNKNHPYFARIYIYMPCRYIVEIRVIACLVF